MKFDTLYKRTSTGKVQEWTLEVEGNQYRTISGQTTGKKTTSKWTVCKGKNIGKANATTDEEQALKEAQAVYQKKLDKHYYKDISKVDEVKFVKPLLAKSFDKHPHVQFGRDYSQPKLDGVRCIVTKDGMFYRSGKAIASAPHIYKALKPIFDQFPDFIFDGELYASHLKDDFEKLISLARKAKPNEEELKECAENLQYWIYDMVDFTIPFSNRINVVRNMIDKLHPSLVVCPTTLLTSQEQMDELYQSYLQEGQEGQMIRNGNSVYEGKRSKNLLKRKEFKDEEFTIIDIIEGQGNWTGYAKSVAYLNKDGNRFDSGIKGTQAYCKDLLENKDKYIGKTATVRYQNMTSAGIPRFPVTYHIWEDEKV